MVSCPRGRDPEHGGAVPRFTCAEDSRTFRLDGTCQKGMNAVPDRLQAQCSGHEQYIRRQMPCSVSKPWRERHVSVSQWLCAVTGSPGLIAGIDAWAYHNSDLPLN